MLKKVLTQTLVLLLLLALSLAAGCGSGDSETTAQTASDDAGAAALTIGSTKGHLAPDFTLLNLAGGDLTLSNLRGKAVIVDFWDTWCGPCRVALPHLQELSETYTNELVVVGVAFGREGEAKVRSFTKANGLTFEMVLLGKTSTILADYGGIQSIPTTFLIDADGVIQKKWIGGANKSSYEQAILSVINDKG